MEMNLSAAKGYIDLGMLEAANEELEEISPELRHSTAVLEIRAEIYARLEKWDLASNIEAALLSENTSPERFIHCAYAIRRARGIPEAEKILRQGEALHPTFATIKYNLACYAAQTGRISEAKALLKAAFSLDEGCRLWAVDDPDLLPIF